VKWWPHDESKLASAPVVVFCCLVIGAAVAFSPDLTPKNRLVAGLVGPAYFFSFGWFSVSLILRVVGHLRSVAIGLFYLGYTIAITGLGLVLGRWLGLWLEPGEEMALDALQVAGIVGGVVAAKQSIDRPGASRSTEGAR
jgi:hypothetical protein